MVSQLRTGKIIYIIQCKFLKQHDMSLVLNRFTYYRHIRKQDIKIDLKSNLNQIISQPKHFKSSNNFAKFCYQSTLLH